MKEVFCCAFSPSGGMCASGSEDETLRFWDPQTGHNTRTIPAHADPVTSVDFSGNGECICTSSFDGTVRLWNARDGNVIVTFTAKLPIAPPAGCARFTPNSKYIAVSYLSSFGMLVDIGNLAGINNSKSNNEQQGSTDMDAATQQLKAMRKFVSHTNDEFAAFLAFPHLPRVSGGRGLLFGSEDGHSCLYEIQSAKVAQRLDGDSDPSTSTAGTSEFAGNGKGLEAEGGAGTNTTSANASAGTAIEGSKRGHTEAVLAVDAHPKVPLCVTGAMHPDCSVKLWSPRTQFTQQQSPPAQEKQS
jgi:WD40 repeat protein